jgi:hypothetical protein
MEDKITNRQLAAKLARQYYSKEISYYQFVDSFPEETDSEIFELFDLIEHEPKQGGFLGVSKIDHDLYLIDIFKLIELLEGK